MTSWKWIFVGEMNGNEVIVLDEIEKAHRSFAKALLTVFGEYGNSTAQEQVDFVGDPVVACVFLFLFS